MQTIKQQLKTAQSFLTAQFSYSLEQSGITKDRRGNDWGESCLIEIEGQLFDWNKAKNLSNISKHGIPFKLAATVFSDPNSVVLDDKLHSQGEDRFIAIGLCKNLNLLVVCHCYREDDTVIRIISARKANTTETKMYGGAI